MKTKVMIINAASVAAILCLLVGLAAAFMAFYGRADLDAYKTIFNLASLGWFLTSPLWFVPKLFGSGFEEAGRRAWLRPKGGDGGPDGGGE